MSDAVPSEGQKDLEVEIATGDLERSLVAMRDYVAHELQGNRCPSCEISKLRTGDTAALVLRLQKIVEDLHALKPTAKSAEGVVSLDDIRNRRASGRVAVSSFASESGLGTKKSARRQTGRQPRFK